MTDPFVAEIRIFPFNFAPRGWAWCDGQLLPIAQNTALFSLLGTTYGGDGRTTFALPNLQGRAPMHPGQGPGLSQHHLGEAAGTETVTLLESEMPSHAHALVASLGATDEEGERNPAGNYTGVPPLAQAFYGPANSLAAMSANTIAPAGGNQPHNNLQPYLTLYFCIALQGVYPPRS